MDARGWFPAAGLRHSRVVTFGKREVLTNSVRSANNGPGGVPACHHARTANRCSPRRNFLFPRPILDAWSTPTPTSGAPHCGWWLERSTAFPANIMTRDHLSSWCRDCHREANRESGLDAGRPSGDSPAALRRLGAAERWRCWGQPLQGVRTDPGGPAHTASTLLNGGANELADDHRGKSSRSR